MSGRSPAPEPRAAQGEEGLSATVSPEAARLSGAVAPDVPDAPQGAIGEQPQKAQRTAARKVS